MLLIRYGYVQQAKIDRMGRAGFTRSIKPLVRPEGSNSVVMGFDTEYTSKQNKLICYQLWGNDHGKLWTVAPGKKLTPQALYNSACELLGTTPIHITMVTYFSLAELQFLPVATEGFNIWEYANGSLDVDFKVQSAGRYQAILSIFDIARFFNRQSLKSVAKGFGLEKLEYDVKSVTRKYLQVAKFRKYAIKDAKLCFDICARLRRSFKSIADVDILSAKTPANASQRVFRKLFVRDTYYCDENDARLLAMRGAWGGRAEVFKRGQLSGNYTEWDFTSAYPTACIKIGEFPVQKSWKEYRRWSDLKKAKGGFFHVRFKFPTGTRYPSLPVSAKDSLIFPLEGSGYCTLYELRCARRAGAETRVLDGWYFNRGTRVLSDYMQLVMEQRSKADGANKIMWKLLANALTGKFAQAVSKIPISEYLRLAEELDTTLDDIMDLSKDELAALGVYQHVSVGAVFMPEWYGLITGYTRAALSLAIESAGAVYCHTDSVWGRRTPTCDDMLPMEKKGTGKVKIIRTRLACIGTGHMPSHSIWSKKATKELLKRFKKRDITMPYDINRPLKFRESVKSGSTVGKWVTETRMASTKWDGKRRLIRNNDTLPWQNVQEYLDYRDATK